MTSCSFCPQRLQVTLESTFQCPSSPNQKFTALAAKSNMYVLIFVSVLTFATSHWRHDVEGAASPIIFLNPQDFRDIGISPLSKILFIYIEIERALIPFPEQNTTAIESFGGVSPPRVSSLAFELASSLPFIDVLFCSSHWAFLVYSQELARFPFIR